MDKISSSLDQRLKEVERQGGGRVGVYPAILAIYRTPVKGSLFGKPEGYFLAVDPDLSWALGGDGVHTDDNVMNSLPGEKGVYRVTVAVDWELGYSEGYRHSGEDDWTFHILTAEKEMSLDLPEQSQAEEAQVSPSKGTEQGSPIDYVVSHHTDGGYRDDACPRCGNPAPNGMCFFCGHGGDEDDDDSI
jgi:hypothetical protein